MGDAATDHRAVAVVVGQLCLMPQPRAAAACLWRRWHLFEESEAMSQLAPPPDGSNAAFEQGVHEKTVETRCQRLTGCNAEADPGFIVICSSW